MAQRPESLLKVVMSMADGEFAVGKTNKVVASEELKRPGDTQISSKSS